jgi:hypothetical protein
VSNLTLTFADVYGKVSEYAADTGDTDDSKAKDLAYRGYRQFLYPVNPKTGRLHIWSFLKQVAVINTSSGKWEYELPDDFGYLSMMPKFGANSNYPNPTPTSVSQIYEFRSLNTSESHPKCFALSVNRYFPDFGQKYNLLFHPPPDGVYAMYYGYVIEPPKPTVDTDVLAGGVMSSEAILESVLAVTEQWKDDKVGVHTQLAQKLINQLIAADTRFAPDSVGYNLNPQAIFDSPALARELRWIGAATAAYGITL